LISGPLGSNGYCDNALLLMADGVRSMWHAPWLLGRELKVTV